ncbi:M48 family metalloprotease [Natronobacterium texcoconense]|uniref:STE24 endopeptidase n=1 Tax=Natronobacterium texcoconense TaxID=1095778 RepID=A0A1H1IBH8_NATTX|nr:hypothetical protein [Natronobacterium texcoconense]SDR35085.1 STE24 endopeptidase [Natronobacterium texcoconense]
MAIAIVTAAVVFVAVCPPAYWIAARAAARRRRARRWIHRLAVSLWGVAALAFVTFSLLGIGDLGRSSLGAVLPSLEESLVGDVAAFGAISLASLGVTVPSYLALLPATDRILETDVSIRDELVWLGQFGLTIAALISFALAVLFQLPFSDGRTFSALLLLALLTVVVFEIGFPQLTRTLRDARSVTDAEADRLTPLLEHAAFDTTDVCVVEDTDDIEVRIVGPPGRRHLFVSATTLETLEDDALEALFALHTGRIRTYHVGMSSYALLGFVVAGVVALGWGNTATVSAVIFLGLVASLPVQWAARRALYRADAYAGTVVGRDVLARTFVRVADEQDLELSRGKFWYLLRARPPLGRRIDRLRNDA